MSLNNEYSKPSANAATDDIFGSPQQPVFSPYAQQAPQSFQPADAHGGYGAPAPGFVPGYQSAYPPWPQQTPYYYPAQPQPQPQTYASPQPFAVTSSGWVDWLMGRGGAQSSQPGYAYGSVAPANTSPAPAPAIAATATAIDIPKQDRIKPLLTPEPSSDALSSNAAETPSAQTALLSAPPDEKYAFQERRFLYNCKVLRISVYIQCAFVVGLLYLLILKGPYCRGQAHYRMGFAMMGFSGGIVGALAYASVPTELIVFLCFPFFLAVCFSILLT